MKIAVIGGVKSTAVLIEKLREYQFEQVKVWSYHPSDTSLVSGWVNLANIANNNGYEAVTFFGVVDCVNELTAFAPDIVFAVGLSQLVPKSILGVPPMGCIGFHPTALPEGRGRAPIAWIVLGKVPGAATFFKMRDGVDNGPILVQRRISVEERDDAESVEKMILDAESDALDELLPNLKRGVLSGVEQDEYAATRLGRRKPEDGLIDWHESATDIARLIRASTSPHPGAFTFHESVRIRILKSAVVDFPESGVLGRILSIGRDGGSFVVQCGSGILKVSKWEADKWHPKVGMLLGYRLENEIFTLRNRVQELERQVGQLVAQLATVLSRLTK